MIFGSRLGRMIYLFLLLIALPASANLDPFSGARVSLVATQTLLTAPPLPKLDATKGNLTVQGSYIAATAEGRDTVTRNDYSGKFTGGDLGFGYSTPADKGIGYFATGIISKLSGEAQTTATDALVHEFMTTGYATTFGMSKRLIGRDDSVFILGVFGGPALMYFQSALTIDGTTYKSSPLMYGMQLGAQIKIRIGKWSFTPYALYMQELSGKCKTIVSSDGTVDSSESCGGDTFSQEINASFSAYGIVIGTKDLQLNVYSKLMNHPLLSDISVLNLGLSYSF
jgi:hypothetical protein